MKNTIRILCLLLALCMALSLGVFASGEPSGEASEAGEAKSVEEAFIEYIHNWLLDELAINSLMTEDIVENEYMPLVRAFDFVSFPAEMLYNGMLEQGCPMTFEEFAAQYQPDAKSVEEAYIDYARDFLQKELLVNSYMTQEQIDNEFMPLVEAHDYETFPAYNMYHDGWFVNGKAMTFEEFAAQYVPAGGSVTWQDYIDFLWNSFKDTAPNPDALKSLLDSTPDWAFIEENIESGPWYKFFGEDYYNATTWDEFAANGGVGTFNADFVDSAGGAS